ncbi:MAG: winged helix-turn-helix domain-containing protein [Pseudohongiella sp.]|uniref:winged helix-turn-helix domain-containing protein n=1 Tax=Pseudohongiella sp. TaxID=1979412 RepID=UPI0034A0AB60
MAPSDACSRHNDTIYHLGDWQVWAGPGMLVKGEFRMHAEPKVMDVLLCLIRSQGRLVTRDELLREVWPRVVVNEEVLTRAISELRTLLGDVSRERRYIKTVPKRGYMLVMPAVAVSAETPPDQRHDVPRKQTHARLTAWHVAGMWIARPGLMSATVLVVTLISYDFWARMDARPVTSASLDSAQSAPQLKLQRELASMSNALNVGNATGQLLDGNYRQILLAPLTVLTDDDQTRAFAAGLTADLQHELAQQPSFQVVSQSDSAALQPELTLGGNVRIYQQQARINLQLVETQNAILVWSGSFEVPLSSPLRVQSFIAKRVSNELAQA